MSTGERAAGGLEALQRDAKHGWMDSTDFKFELGSALGGNKIFPSKEDCTANHECIQFPDEHYPCIAKEVIILCADALAPHIAAAKEREEKLWALHDDLECKAKHFKELAGKAAALHNLSEYGKWIAKWESIDDDRHRLAAILEVKGGSTQPPAPQSGSEEKENL